MANLAMKVLKWMGKGNVGISSATMAAIACSLDRPIYGSHFGKPHDPSDLRRCMLLVDEIPEIRDHFPAIAEKCPALSPVLEKWDELIACLRSEIASGTGRAPKTYAMMEEIQGD